MHTPNLVLQKSDAKHATMVATFDRINKCFSKVICFNFPRPSDKVDHHEAKAGTLSLCGKHVQLFFMFTPFVLMSSCLNNLYNFAQMSNSTALHLFLFAKFIRMQFLLYKCSCLRHSQIQSRIFTKILLI